MEIKPAPMECNDPDVMPKALTQDELSIITDFFDSTYDKAPHEDGMLEICKWIFSQHFNIKDIDDNYFDANCITLNADLILFHNDTDIFTALFCYFFVLFQKKLITRGRDAFLLKKNFITKSSYTKHLMFGVHREFVVYFDYYHPSTNSIESISIHLSLSKTFRALWEVSQLDTREVLRIKEAVVNNKMHPGQYNDNVQSIFNLLQSANYFDNQVEFDKATELGINPFTLPRRLFKMPESPDILSAILFMRWHDGTPSYYEQLSIIDQVLSLPDKCKTILSAILNDVKTGRFHFELDGFKA
jgi:hypothetical protein